MWDDAATIGVRHHSATTHHDTSSKSIHLPPIRPNSPLSLSSIRLSDTLTKSKEKAKAKTTKATPYPLHHLLQYTASPPQPRNTILKKISCASPARHHLACRTQADELRWIVQPEPRFNVSHNSVLPRPYPPIPKRTLSHFCTRTRLIRCRRSRLL